MADHSLHITLDMATPATDTTYTLTPGTERGDLLTPDIDKLGHETSVKEAPTTPNSTDEPPADDDDSIDSIVPERPSTKQLIDRQDVLIATMLTRFSQLIKIAMEPEEENATLENQAANSLQLEVELQALVKTTEDLLKLSRELKELWLAGPLRGIGEGEGDGTMTENAKKVQELVDRITTMARENGVGSDGKFH